MRAVKDRNRAFMSAVDAEVKGDIESLKLLTAISNIERNDFAQIHRDLAAAAATQPNWISVILLSSNGQQLVNTAVPYGTVPPQANDANSLRLAVGTQQPVIGVITRGRLLDSMAFLSVFPLFVMATFVDVDQSLLPHSHANFNSAFAALELPRGSLECLYDLPPHSCSWGPTCYA